MIRAKLLGVMLAAGATATAQTAAPTPTNDAPQYPPGLYAVITTSAGDITARLFENEAPNTVHAFMGLALGSQPWLDPKTRKPATHPLYQNLIFHRVIPEFMIQTGDPTETGAHDCGFKLPDEFVDTLKFDRPGRLAMANAGPGTAACQFFITESPYPTGNGHYTIFGQVVNGQPLVAKISHVLRDDRDRPRLPAKLIKITFMRVILKPTPDK
jgi:cyclophilin family peptidyl-prolyl cis-trans isomerase